VYDEMGIMWRGTVVNQLLYSPRIWADGLRSNNKHELSFISGRQSKEAPSK
jgi:hypothetical protein